MSILIGLALCTSFPASARNAEGAFLTNTNSIDPTRPVHAHKYVPRNKKPTKLRDSVLVKEQCSSCGNKRMIQIFNDGRKEVFGRGTQKSSSPTPKGKNGAKAGSKSKSGSKTKTRARNRKVSKRKSNSKQAGTSRKKSASSKLKTRTRKGKVTNKGKVDRNDLANSGLPPHYSSPEAIYFFRHMEVSVTDAAQGKVWRDFNSGKISKREYSRRIKQIQNLEKQLRDFKKKVESKIKSDPKNKQAYKKIYKKYVNQIKDAVKDTRDGRPIKGGRKRARVSP